MTRLFQLAIPFCMAVFLTGCATVPAEPHAAAEFKANNDPLEPMNRKIFAGNLFLDRVLIKPVAKGYRKVLPEPVRDALRRVVDNLKEPIVAANSLLQGRFKTAGITTGRFVVNSTVGVAGIGDVATGWKLPKQSADFGQTLSVWGIPPGPYLVLPVWGPSSPRDGFGAVIDGYFDPVRHVDGDDGFADTVANVRTGVEGIDERARNLDTLDKLQQESVDYYASLRSLYRQNRAAELGDGSAAAPPPEFYEDPAGEEPGEMSPEKPANSPDADVDPVSPSKPAPATPPSGNDPAEAG